MGYRQEYWSGLPFPSPGDLPDPGIEPGSPALQADSLNSLLSESPGKPLQIANKLSSPVQNQPPHSHPSSLTWNTQLSHSPSWTAQNYSQS